MRHGWDQQKQEQKHHREDHTQRSQDVAQINIESETLTITLLYSELLHVRS